MKLKREMMEWTKVYNNLSKRNWIVLLILACLSSFLTSPSLTLGINLGGFIIIANFQVMQYTIRRVFPSDGAMKEATKISIMGRYYFRLLILGAIIYILVTEGLVDPVGLAIGLSTVVISITSFGINRAWKTITNETV